MVGAVAAGQEEPLDEKFVTAEKTKLRKKVESAFRRGKGEFFAIAVSETTYLTEVERDVVQTGVVNGQVRERKSKEFKTGGEYFPVPEAEFKVVQGKEAAVDLIVEHMAKYIRKPKGRRAQAEEAPPPTGEWTLINRFDNEADAANALNEAKATFDAMPNWKSTAKLKEGDAAKDDKKDKAAK